MPITRWTEKEILLLKKILADGQGRTAEEIARIIGRPRNAVIGYCHRKGLALPCSQSEGSRRAAARRAGLLTPAEREARAERARERERLRARQRRQDRAAAAPPPEPEPSPDASRREPVGCRWVHGDPAAGPWHYCQAPQRLGSPYCEHHAARAMARPSARAA